MKPSPISTALLVVSLFLAPALLAQSPDSANQGAASSAASAAEVPRLIKFSGTLLDAQDRPLAGPVGVTFALHAQQTGGAALWMETQNVKPDASGFYTVLLGANSADGVPAELFASGEARWLEVQVERQAEQPRILLVSVPYALKAKDAETLGGKPASAFLTTETLATAASLAGAATAAPTFSSSTASPTSPAQTTPKKAASGPQPAAVCPNVTSDGAAAVSSLAKFTTACNIQSSAISENNGQVGIGGAPSTTAKLFLTDRQTNFGTRWLQQNIFSTLATANGSNTVYTLDLDTTNMSISPGVTDSGARVALRSLAYANNPGFAGTLNQQIGTLAQAGIRSATGGARVNSAYGGLFSVLNQVPGTTITNAYGVWIQNSDAVGTITHRYDLYASSPNANNFFAGNVGIGTTTPVDKLDVAGNVNIVGNLNLPATTSATMGVMSLGGAPFAHNFGAVPTASNTFIGVGAGNFSMTGAHNTAVGASALTNNTTGFDNSAFGASALTNNTTACCNSAFGINALFFNTSGGWNNAFGFSALGSNTMGAANNAFGYGALTANTIGGWNNAFGFNALGSNTTGTNNNAFGSSALIANTIGISNSAFGDVALTSNTTGSSNSAFGADALVSSTGMQNSAFGAGALVGLKSGSSNIAIGAFAGVNLATGSNDIYIGNAGVSSESNIIRIGSTQTATFIAGTIMGNLNGNAATATNFSGKLAGEVTGTQNATVVSSAVVPNTANTIVRRDASGSFAAGTIALSGNLALPNTTSASAGVLTLGGVPFAHNFASSPSSNNTFLGIGAGNFSLTGVDNTAVGASTLTANTMGTANSAFGARALQNNTTGSNDSAFGSAALEFNTTGPYNSAFGSQALQRNTTGPNNSAFGQGALSSNTAGSDNSAFGFVALSSNTYASSNSAFGSHALDNNTNGSRNSAFGFATLLSNTDGSGNSAFGSAALQSNTGGLGNSNSAFGVEALFANTTGGGNSAFGYTTLLSNTTGGSNSAFGDSALSSNTTGFQNAAFGHGALDSLRIGSFNVAIGTFAGASLTQGSSNIYIGNTGAQSESDVIRIGDPLTHKATFIAGISGATNANGTPVLVNSSGQLGTLLSSRRFKDVIADMADESDLLMKLRPVSFYYKPELDPTHTRQYGLVAEEVAQVSPELVVFDKDGAPQTVRYHFVNAMLLNEVQKQRQLVDEQRKANEDQQSTIARQQAEIQDLAARLAKLEALVAPAP